MKINRAIIASIEIILNVVAVCGEVEVRFRCARLFHDFGGVVGALNFDRSHGFVVPRYSDIRRDRAVSRTHG